MLISNPTPSSSIASNHPVRPTGIPPPPLFQNICSLDQPATESSSSLVPPDSTPILQLATSRAPYINETQLPSAHSTEQGPLPLDAEFQSAPSHSSFIFPHGYPLQHLQQSAVTALHFLAGIQPSSSPIPAPLNSTELTNTNSLTHSPFHHPPLSSGPAPNLWLPTVCLNAKANVNSVPSSNFSSFYNTSANSPFPLSHPPRAVHLNPNSPHTTSLPKLDTLTSPVVRHPTPLRRSSSAPSVPYFDSLPPPPPIPPPPPDTSQLRPSLQQAFSPNLQAPSHLNWDQFPPPLN